MGRRSAQAAIIAAVALWGCGNNRPPVSAKPEITVAAAANLTGVFGEIGNSFTRETGIKVTLSYASTAQLAQQVENGAPFDVFAAADIEHVDDLIRKGRLVPDSRAIYARGQLALWIPKGEALGVAQIADLATPKIRFIAIANPRVAPYGQAAIDALRSSSLWPKVEPKVVYATNIGAAKQLAASGNADAAFTAYSLVLKEPGRVIVVNGRLHAPIDQAMALVTATPNADLARRFMAHPLGRRGRGILERSGYLLPGK
jgi:molybdate transport system substrate-binding protein